MAPNINTSAMITVHSFSGFAYRVQFSDEAVLTRFLKGFFNLRPLLPYRVHG
jgi:hypothetical protein